MHRVTWPAARSYDISSTIEADRKKPLGLAVYAEHQCETACQRSVLKSMDCVEENAPAVRINVVRNDVCFLKKIVDRHSVLLPTLLLKGK